MAEVDIETQARIYREMIILKMLQDGFELKGTTVQQLKDQAKKSGLNPDDAVTVYESLIKEVTERIFAKK